jgi:glutamate-1-semialdehyde 2,1-aminomutase
MTTVTPETTPPDSPASLRDGAGQRLYRYARSRIPGGTQLMSKKPELFLPEEWPAYFSRAKGAEVWDLDGRKYTDMAYTAIGAAVLGVADDEVDAAVTAVIRDGAVSTLMCPEEVQLADLLCELHPWADMVRYARGGGEAMAIAVRIARARTLRDVVAFCGYHGWQDWYVAANLSDSGALDDHLLLLPGLSPAGVPRGLAGTALPFRYNRLDELEAIVHQHGDSLAAIVMEPVRGQDPAPGFLEGVRALADRCGAVLVFDEVTSGFRVNTGGIHLTLGTTPDIAVFAKALGNGYPIAAIVGTGDAMSAAAASFISSTSWTERIGPTAALATLRKHRRDSVPHHLIARGQEVQSCWRTAAQETGLDIKVGGIPPLANLTFAPVEGPEPADSQTLRTLFTQLMLERSFLAASSFYATFAHTPEQVAAYAAAVQETFAIIADAVERGEVRKRLRVPTAHPGFARLT